MSKEACRVERTQEEKDFQQFKDLCNHVEASGLGLLLRQINAVDEVHIPPEPTMGLSHQRETSRWNNWRSFAPASVRRYEDRRGGFPCSRNQAVELLRLPQFQLAGTGRFISFRPKRAATNAFFIDVVGEHAGFSARAFGRASQGRALRCFDGKAGRSRLDQLPLVGRFLSRMNDWRL
ncbi:uncharacterized protein EI90DRAFT_3032592 [Cantharellus anzutake]|uniref:uncharacterized protein n=1 Tax=Cantharellus anzutake TaxID=1750568 RepID=UPI0019051251|nr:uncharacterized protein EI90DRAFT_3032592 [Cantharellus anzutake]KAF8342244.1 hypothetical protein EI90DRAFT_3032592 [Cantharellus anzutake]